MASTADSTVPYAVMITTGNSALTRFTACRNSRPLMPGSLKSVTTRSKGSLPRSCRPVSASGRRAGVKSLFGELQFEQAPHLGSSSTIKIDGFSGFIGAV